MQGRSAPTMIASDGSPQTGMPMSPHSPLHVELREAQAKVEVLSKSQDVLHEKVERVRAAPLSGWTFSQFGIGLAMSHVTVLFIGSHPDDTWLWHVLCGCVLFPMDAYRHYRTGKQAFLVEFCWVTNQVIWCFMMLVAVDQFSKITGAPAFGFSQETRGAMYRALCAFCGPLAGSVFIYPQGNAWVPHNVELMTGLLIHLSPVVSMYFLRWFAADGDWIDEQYGRNPLHKVDVSHHADGSSIGFFEYMQWPLCWVVTYTVMHYSTLMLFGITQNIHAPKDWQQMTSYYAEASKPKGNANNPLPVPSFAQLIGKMGDGKSEALRFLKYELLADCRLLCMMAATYPWFMCPYHSVHLVIIGGILARALWNGAVWQSLKLEGIDHALDVELNRAKKEQTKVENKVQAEMKREEKKRSLSEMSEKSQEGKKK